MTQTQTHDGTEGIQGKGTGAPGLPPAFVPGDGVPGKPGWVYEELQSDRGGFGLVHRLRDCGTGTCYAMKTLRPERLRDVTARNAFAEEARRLAGLPAHPNLVRAVHITKWKDQLCLVTEFVEGWPLDALHGRSGTGDVTTKGRAGGLTLVDQLTLFMDICRALGAIWESDRIAHLDLKPANVMIDAGGKPRVLDFGLSRTITAVRDGGEDTGAPINEGEPADPDALDAGDAAASRTFVALMRASAGHSLFRLAGTLAYMAPEQFAGPDRCDTRSDVYAMGVLMYEVVTGRLPLRPEPEDGDTVRAYARLHRERAVDAVPGCEPRLAAVVLRCLCKPRTERYPSFRELFAAVDDIYFAETALHWPWDPSPFETPDDLANHAYILLQCGRADAEALRQAERALKLAPENYHARFVHGVALRVLNRAAEAEPIFAQLLAERPGDAPTLRQAACVAAVLGRPGDALRLHERAAALLPGEDELNHGSIAATLATMAERAPNSAARSVLLSRARGHLEQGLAAHPDSEFLCNQLIEVSRLDGSLPALAGRLRSRLAADWDGSAHCQFGWICELMARDERDESRRTSLREEAVGLLEKAGKINDANAYFWYQMGLAQDALARHGQAIACYDRALELDGREATFANSKVSSLRQAGRADEAVAFGERWEAEARHQANAHFWNQMGLAQDALARYGQAVACYDRALELDGGEANCAGNKVSSLQEGGGADEAVAFGERWEAEACHQANAYFWNQVGMAQDALAQHGQAIACYDRALELDGGEAVFAGNKMSSLREGGRADEAVAFGERWEAEACHQANAYFWHQMGLAQDALAQYGQAVACYDRALELDGGEASFAGNKVSSLLEGGRVDEAVAFGEQWEAEACHQANAHFWNGMGLAHCALARDDQAIACYDRALELDGGNAVFASNKVSSLRHTGRADEAVAFGEQWEAEACHQANAHFWNHMGLAQGALARHGQAIACYDHALELDGGEASFAGNKVSSLRQAGRADEAVAFGEQWNAEACHQANTCFWRQMRWATLARTPATSRGERQESQTGTQTQSDQG